MPPARKYRRTPGDTGDGGHPPFAWTDLPYRLEADQALRTGMDLWLEGADHRPHVLPPSWPSWAWRDTARAVFRAGHLEPELGTRAALLLVQDGDLFNTLGPARAAEYRHQAQGAARADAV